MKLRVVHIITRMILGGAQENTVLTLEGLRKNPQYAVSLITGPPERPEIEGELIDRVRRDNITTTVLPSLCREIHPVKDLIAFVQLWWLLMLQRPHIVHTHSSKAGILGRVAAKLAGIPVIVHTIHGLPFHPYQSSLLNLSYVLLERIATAMSTHVITVGEVMKQNAIDAQLAPASKFTVIYSGIEMDRFTMDRYDVNKIKRALGIPEKKPVAGCIARLFPLKGHDYLLEATRQLIHEGEDFMLLLVGDGSLRPKLEDYVRRNKLDAHVHFAGLVPSERIPEMIAAMDFLVHPSLREGLPRAIVQAMAMGKPAVAFDVDGAREVIQHGVTGYLLKPGSVDGLAAAMKQFLHVRDRVHAKGPTHMQRIRDRFSSDRMVKEIDRLYHHLLRS